MWKKEVKQGTGGISVNKKRLYRTQGSYRMLVFVCTGIMNKFADDEEGGVIV